MQSLVKPLSPNSPQVVNTLKPPTVKVVAALCMVRNSVGENCYVSDEVITAKSGMRVRVGNTDAEGRMAMADALYHLKEMAVNAVNPHLFTIATLTGHAVLTAGEGYSVSINCEFTFRACYSTRPRFGPRSYGGSSRGGRSNSRCVDQLQRDIARLEVTKSSPADRGSDGEGS